LTLKLFPPLTPIEWLQKQGALAKRGFTSPYAATSKASCIVPMRGFTKQLHVDIKKHHLCQFKIHM